MESAKEERGNYDAVATVSGLLLFAKCMVRRFDLNGD